MLDVGICVLFVGAAAYAISCAMGQSRKFVKLVGRKYLYMKPQEVLNAFFAEKGNTFFMWNWYW